MIKTAFSVTMALLVALMLTFPCYGEEMAGIPPKVIATHPRNGSQDIDPSLSEISVTFNEAMMDKSWSWAYENKDGFPQAAGDPYYTKGNTKCVLPVQLEPGREYVIWINTARLRNFRNNAGIPAEPYRLTFKTR